MNKSELDYLIIMTGLGTSVKNISASVFPIENQLTPRHTHISALIILDIC